MNELFKHLLRDKRRHGRDIRLSDLVKESLDPFLEDKDSAVLRHAIQRLLKAASLERLDQTSRSWKAEGEVQTEKSSDTASWTSAPHPDIPATR